MVPVRTLFTLHAGELLVAEEVKRRFRDVDLWVPLKDTGIDLLVTRGARHVVSLQVKFSTDLLKRRPPDVVAKGWWTFRASKIQESKADLWVLVIYPLPPARPRYLVVAPQELAERMTGVFGPRERIQSFIHVTRDGRCWETGGLLRDEALDDDRRDFTRYLDAWDELERRLEANKVA